MRTPTRTRNAGFTLIELLVVVAIIGLLTAAATAGFNVIRQRSRDAKRVSDAKTLQKALALYFTSKSSYPNPTAAGGVCLTNTDAISTMLKNENAIAKVPTDPTVTCVSDPTCCLLYASTDGTTYSLRYTLESTSGVGTSGNHSLGPI